jgi:hypothetical protein
MQAQQTLGEKARPNRNDLSCAGGHEHLGNDYLTASGPISAEDMLIHNLGTDA